MEKEDKTTTIIDIRFEKMCDFVRFHKICDATIIQMTLSLGLSNEADDSNSNAVEKSNVAQEITAEMQMTPNENASPNNEATSAKRKSTEMDSVELET